MASDRLLDLISVHQSRRRQHHGVLTAAGAVVACAVGRSGIIRMKREGDGATPAGTWPMRYVLYRPDRMFRPATRLPALPLAPGDGWCDCPTDRHYNRPVRLPRKRSAEGLWRKDGLYDLIVVLGYNDDPPVAGRGSAIFFHLASDGLGPTAGCVAVSRGDMVKLIARCGPGTRMRIGG